MKNQDQDFFYTDMEPGVQFNSKQSRKYERNNGRYDDEFYHDSEVSKKHKKDKNSKLDRSVARKAKREGWE